MIYCRLKCLNRNKKKGKLHAIFPLLLLLVGQIWKSKENSIERINKSMVFFQLSMYTLTIYTSVSGGCLSLILQFDLIIMKKLCVEHKLHYHINIYASALTRGTPATISFDGKWKLRIIYGVNSYIFICLIIIYLCICSSHMYIQKKTAFSSAHVHSQRIHMVIAKVEKKPLKNRKM